MPSIIYDPNKTMFSITRGNLKQFFHKYNPELIFLISGLAFLIFIHPDNETHFSFCLFKNLGFEFCPGCGLGKSISYLFHFNLRDSFNSHPFGIPAFLIILHRIISLLRNSTLPIKASAELKTGAHNA